MKAMVAGIVCALALPLLVPGLEAQAAASLALETPHVPRSVVSDWTHRHLLYPDSKDASVMERVRKDPRWAHNWYLRHPTVSASRLNLFHSFPQHNTNFV